MCVETGLMCVRRGESGAATAHSAAATLPNYRRHAVRFWRINHESLVAPRVTNVPSLSKNINPNNVSTVGAPMSHSTRTRTNVRQAHPSQ